MKKEETDAPEKGCGNAIGCLLLLPVVAGVGVFALLSMPSADNNGAPPTSLSPAVSQYDASPPISTQGGVPGQARQKRLIFGGQPVLVATTEEVASQIANDINARNTDALARLEKDGDAYIVDNETPVVVVGSDRYIDGGYVVHVRISGGPSSGEDGWVPGEYVH